MCIVCTCIRANLVLSVLLSRFKAVTVLTVISAKELILFILNNQFFLACNTFLFSNSLKLASQMWLLGRLLPVMIGHFVPDVDIFWKNYLLLLKIMDYLFSPITSQGNCQYLQVHLQYMYLCVCSFSLQK